MDALVANHGCGVVVVGNRPDQVEEAAAALCALIDDSGTPQRCRAAAAEHFDLRRGVSRLLEIYQIGLHH
jgi:glycosyltransferase involved in cell wall biosynthesis